MNVECLDQACAGCVSVPPLQARVCTSATGAGDRAAGGPKQDALEELRARGDAEEQTAVGLAWGGGGGWFCTTEGKH